MSIQTEYRPLPGYTIVTPESERTKKIVSFAYSFDENGMAVPELPRGSSNPAPLLDLEPLNNLGTAVSIPGFGTLPPAINESPTPVPMMAESTVERPRTAKKKAPGVNAGIPSGNAAPSSPAVSRPSKKVTVVGEFQDLDIMCHEASVDDHGFVTIVTPSSQQLKLNPQREVDIIINGVQHTCWFTGICVPVPSFGITIRVLGTSVPEQPSD